MFDEDYTPRIRISEPDETVQLQQFGIGDARALFEVVDYDRSHLRAFAPNLVQDVTSVDTALTRLANFDTTKIKFGIWDEGLLRGGIDLMPQAGGRAEVGYWVGGEHTGNGYASRATGLLARWTFRTMVSFDTVYAKIRTENLPSQRAISKAGFQLDGEYNGWLRYALYKEDADLD